MKSILSCFSNELRLLMSHVQQLQSITRVIKPLLPQNLQSQVRVGNWRDGTLVLVADNASVATELRFIQHDLLSSFRGEGGLCNLRRIEIRVQLPTDVVIPPRVVRPAPPVTPRVGNLMVEMANQVEDAPLQEALLRLAKTLRND